MQYTRNTVTGMSTSQVVVLLVDARNGVVEQTIRHLTVAKLLGVRTVILAVNKIDLVGYSEETFNKQGKVEALEAAVRGGALNGGELVGEDGLRVVQEAADEGGLAVVDGAGGAQAQRFAVRQSGCGGGGWSGSRSHQK